MSLTSKYLERFSKLKTRQLPLRGNRVLVEVLPKEEFKAGNSGLIMAAESDSRTSTEQNRADLAIVLAVGDGYFNEETGKLEPLDIEVGNVILVSRMGLKLYSQFPGIPEYTKETLALTRDSEVHAAWSSLEEYQAYSKALNS